VLAPDGRWLRDIGGPGDRPGQLGRPKDVAVGPDGAIFVTDAASQRVHAFDETGAPLLTFGGPDAGRFALELPAGVAVWKPSHGPLVTAADFKPDYYILVAEGSALPGVRVFAWRGPWQDGGLGPRASAPPDALTAPSPHVDSPHWQADACDVCHAAEPAVIPPQEADSLCLSCHDGVAAVAEAHSVGRPAAGPNLRFPEGWPLNDGRLGCLTCHDISRHCDRSAQRPVLNPVMLRTFEADRPFAICGECHVSEQPWRVNPHQQLVGRREGTQARRHEGEESEGGRVIAASNGGEVLLDSCLFCHAAAPSIPADGRRTGEAALRIGDEGLCLSCHNRHWDFSPRGHIGRPVTDVVRRNLALAAEQSAKAPLPLNDGRVTCWSCHNPHQEGLFPAGTPLGAHASNPLDRDVALRVNFNQLCFVCHRK
jgi:hypothetical protein